MRLRIHARDGELQKLDAFFFQGFFFSKPVILSKEDIPSQKVGLLRIISEANKPEINFGRLAEMIKSEMSVSYKLLKLVNSASTGIPSWFIHCSM